MSETMAIAPHKFEQSQIDLIRKQVAPAGTTNDELALFLAYAERTGLDPLSRQIYLSERRSQVNGQWTVSRKPEVTIDGFRLVAERTNRYAGQIGPEWCGKDGQWRDVWLENAPPAAARVGVLRHDFKAPVYSVALYREYSQTNKEGQPNSMWKKYPSVMLAKCAESLALRRAFPRELSGLYTREEMPEERHDGKQAAAEVGQERIKQLSAPAAPPFGMTAEELDPEGPAPTVAAMEERAKPVAVPRTPKAKQSPPKVGFEMLGHFKEIKTMMAKESGSDALYYGVLEQYGYKKSSDIPDVDSARAVYKSMVAAHKSLKMANANRAECQEIFDRIGGEKFWQFAGTEGLDTEAFAQLAGLELQAFNNKLREEFPV